MARQVRKSIAGDLERAPSLYRDGKGSTAEAYVTLMWVLIVTGCTSQRIL
jgi:hypothetical protein